MNQEVTVIDGMSPNAEVKTDVAIPKETVPDEPIIEDDKDTEVENLDYTEIKDTDLPPDPEIESLEEKEEKEKEEEEEEEASYSEVEQEAYLGQQSQTQSKLINISKDIQRFSRILEVPKPQAPKDDYDDVEMRRYENKLMRWEERREETIEEVKDLQTHQKQLSYELGDKFKQFHKHDKDLENFEKFILSKNVYYLALYTGEESIEDLYDMWKIKTAKTRKATGMKKVEKAKPKPISTKGSGKVKSGGIPKQFKYANMSMFRDYVADLKKQKTDISGNPMTLKYIDDLCKQEYKVIKGHTVI